MTTSTGIFEKGLARTVALASSSWLLARRTPGAVLVPVLIAAGIVLTFWREIVFATYYGAGVQLDIFRIAYSLPNLLAQGVATAFVAAVLSVLVKYENAGMTKFELVYRKVHLFNAAVISVVTGVGVLTAYGQAWAMAPGMSSSYLNRLTIDIIICWIMFLFVGVTFSLRARQMMARIYWPGAATTAIRAGVFVPCLVLLALFVARKDLMSWMASLIAMVSGLGVYVTHYWGTPSSMQARIVAGRRLRGHVEISYWHLASLLGTAVAVTAIYGMTRFIDRGFASTLGPGAVSVTEYSASIMTAVAMLLGTSFNTVSLANVARLFQGGPDHKAMLQLVGSLFAIFIVCSVISLVGAIWSTRIVDLLFHRGAFNQAAAGMTAIIFRYQVIGLPVSVIGYILSQSLIALEVRKTLIAIMIAKVALKAATMAWLGPLNGLAAIGQTFIIVEIFATVAMIVLAGVTYWKKTRTE